MDNKASIDSVQRSFFDKEWRKPCYGSYCFSHIPDTILELFGADVRGTGSLPKDCLPDRGKFQHVILFFIDAFGWQAFERYAGGDAVTIRTVEQLRDRAVSSCITSQFPSTTAAHVSCILSGRPVYESGIYEWFYYNARVGEIISPLIFARAKDYRVNSLWESGVAPHECFHEPDFLPRLVSHGVEPHIFKLRPYIVSPANRFLLQGAHTHPFHNDDYRAGLASLTRTIQQPRHPTYSYFYFGDYDTICHDTGPHSPEADACAREFFEALTEQVLTPLKGRDDVLVLLTADHGQTTMDSSTTFFLEESLPELSEMLSRDSVGAPLVPAGSERDYFLHIEPQYVDQAVPLLQERFDSRGRVYKTDDLIEEGIFGPPAQISTELRENLAPIVLLPRVGESVFWSREILSHSFKGHHGGLTNAEMDSIFLALDMKQW